MMLPYRRFPLRQMLPSWWMLPWALALPVLLHAVFLHPAPIRAEGIEWPVHDGGPCLGDEVALNMLPIHPQACNWLGAGLPYLPPSKLSQAREWYTVGFIGQPLADFTSLQLGEAYVRALAVDTSYTGGVRLRFNSRVSYACFFEMLVRIHIAGQRYWLDVRHYPVTIYCVTLPPRHIRTNPPLLPMQP